MSTFGRSPASPVGDSVPPPPLNPYPAATVTGASLGRRDLDGAEASFRKAYEIDRTFGETHGAPAVIEILRGAGQVGSAREGAARIRRRCGPRHAARRRRWSAPQP